MISRRMFVATIAAAAFFRAAAVRAGEPSAAAVSTIQDFYAVLLETMKGGPKLGFAGRKAKLAPTINKAFDLGLMTRLTVGPQWQNLAPDDQKQLVDAFSAFSIATYANRFDDYSGEQFEVEPATTAVANGDVIVHSTLVKSDSEPIALDYLMRDEGKGWQIIDVYLSGTVSELATRRSEFSSVLRRSGVAALLDLLQRKVTELSS